MLGHMPMQALVLVLHAGCVSLGTPSMDYTPDGQVEVLDVIESRFYEDYNSIRAASNSECIRREWRFLTLPDVPALLDNRPLDYILPLRWRCLPSARFQFDAPLDVPSSFVAIAGHAERIA